MTARAAPLATYRLQLNASFGFEQAAAIVPYLKALGISHLYASPFMKARAGSTHGYDVVDHNAFNPELGGEAAFQRLSKALADAGLGLILDFVPNHAGVGYADNPWWLDVLEWGPASPHAAAFDIDWSMHVWRGRGRLLLPILGEPYADALDTGSIKLDYDAGAGTFSAWYYEHRLPITPPAYAEILRAVVRCTDAGSSAAGAQLLDLATQFQREGSGREAAGRLKAALAQVEGGAEVIARGLAAFAPAASGPAAIVRLHRLLQRQHYRPAHWRLAATELNYRRFFDISTLAGLRVEDPAIFAAVHGLVTRLIAGGELQGLRLDHIDGLSDPAQYFQRLQELIRRAQQGEDGFYVVMEKILGAGEPLPRFAGVAGTTGYEWLNIISRVLLDGRGLARLERIWTEITGDRRNFGQILIEAKRTILSNILASEFTALARLLARIAAGYYRTRDYPADGLRAALELFILHFPVYRTYLTADGPSPHDRTVIDTALGAARAQWTDAEPEIFVFLRDAATLDLIAGGRRGHSVARTRRFARQLQQFTGPMMAKSLEDTAFYRYHRLIALNEVGGNPAAGAISTPDFHAEMQRRVTISPHGLTATSTHDTKRGEDARARLLALSEIPIEWADAVATWRKMNAPLAGRSAGSRCPSLAHEYMLYQALAGAWQLERPNQAFTERMQAYAVKAAREGKEQTSWTNPDTRYESGLEEFVHGILDWTRSQAFIDSFDAFSQRLALLGALNSLVQVTLKATMPGVPDFYQGTELWDLSLVDPDNRRPVDFPTRAKLVHALTDNMSWPELARSWRDGRIKLALTQRLLGARQALADIFSHGSYQPIDTSGPHRDDILAFARCLEDDVALVIVARRFGRPTDDGRRWPLPESWNATVSTKGFSALQHLLIDRQAPNRPEVAISDLFDVMPVAVLRGRCSK